jgi:glucosamine kinase
MQDRKLFLGIDGGQTTTKSVLADETGRVLGVGAGGPAIHLKDEKTRQHASQALYECIQAALTEAGISGETEFESAFLGFTGVSGPDGPAAKSYAEVTLAQFRIRCLAVDHDARSALAGAIPSMAGVIVIAGTGSIAFGMDESGESARSGGWGYLLGDQGSAYEIGRQALIAVGKAHDGMGPQTSLTRLVLEALQIEDPAQITQIYRDLIPKLRIAAMSAVAAQAAEAGDSIACEIFSEGGRQLGEMACAVARKLQMTESRLVFSAVGGVFQAGQLLWKPYRQCVLAHYPAARVMLPVFPPLGGALILALKQAGISVSAKLLKELTDSFRPLNPAS